jgi:hypothetical protein
MTSMDIVFQEPDAATLNRKLSEALPAIEAAVNELERAQSVSRHILEGVINI